MHYVTEDTETGLAVEAAVDFASSRVPLGLEGAILFCSSSSSPGQEAARASVDYDNVIATYRSAYVRNYGWGLSDPVTRLGQAHKVR